MEDASARPLLWIDRPDALQTFAADLRAESRLALDTEANGFHRYFERVCLVQISTPSRDALVDTLALRDLAPLAPLLADPAVCKVLHGADYDVIGLRRDFGIEIRGLFDTMIAARLVGRTEVGLAALLRDFVGVAVDKASQRADWTVRPLPPHLVEYARGDTRHLVAVAERLAQDLAAAGRAAAAAEEFSLVEARVARNERFAADGWAREPAARRMSPRERGAFKALWEWRDARARQRDVPPFRVLATEAIAALAQRPPADVAALAHVRGVGERLAQAAGRQILAALRDALPTEQPRRADGDDDGRGAGGGGGGVGGSGGGGPLQRAERARFDALRRWRKEAAARRALDAGLLISNGALWEIARAFPRDAAALAAVAEVRRWQVAELGAEILAVLARAAAPAT
ncbi:MAG TPA: HRDC domain-containing protein [Myxococcota bacterium]|jgi:ribonuclease D|nr:HRDC domain-containing protein [Myxococcota bacterium]